MRRWSEILLMSLTGTSFSLFYSLVVATTLTDQRWSSGKWRWNNIGRCVYRRKYYQVILDIFVRSKFSLHSTRRQIGLNLVIPGGTKTLDATGKLVIPGIACEKISVYFNISSHIFNLLRWYRYEHASGITSDGYTVSGWFSNGNNSSHCRWNNNHS